MFLICFQNGSLARKRIKDAYGLDWRTFSDILLRTPTGNGGRILLPYFFPEITPKVTNPCVRRYGGLDPSDPEGNVRAVIEAQAMAMYLHSFWIGIRPQEILVTAGGSQNPGLIQVLADVFGIPVHACSVRESAALGAAFRAARACRQKDEHPLEFEDLYRIFLSMQVLLTSHPSPRAAALYRGKEGLLEIYRDCERHALRAGDPPFQRIKAFQKRLSSLP